VYGVHMVPPMIQAAADVHGWSARLRGRFRFTLERGDLSVEGVRDLSRHTKARAYRGNALSAILGSQTAVVTYLEEHSR